MSVGDPVVLAIEDSPGKAVCSCFIYTLSYIEW